MSATLPTIHLFNGTYTITNEAGVHKTFTVKTQKDSARFAAGKRIVALLTGSDNETSYTGFGFAHDDGRISVWNKKRTPAFNYFAFLLPKAAQALVGSEGVEVEGEFEAKGRTYRVQLSKRCLRCNRKLTTPESIERGYGAECAKALGM